MSSQTWSESQRESKFSVLRNRNFTLLWLGLVVSNSGSWMTLVGLGWLVYDLTGSSVALGLVGAARAVPMIVLPPMGGVIADRLPRLKLLKVTQSLSFLLSGALATLVAAGLIQVWQIVAFSFLTGVINAFDQPTRQALLPDLVRREDLTKAVALQSSAWQGSALFGPTLAGLTIATLGVAGAFYFDALSFLVVVASLYLMRGVPEHGVRTGEPRTLAGDLQAGLAYVRRTPLLLDLLLISTVAGVFGRSFQQLLPAFARDSFHQGSFGLGLLVSAPGAGALAGAAIITLFADVRRKGVVLLASMLSFGVTLVAFSFSRNFALGLVLLFFVGLLSLVFMSMITTVTQIEAAPEMRGRVMSLITVTMQGFSPLGSLVIGSIASLISIEHAVALSAAFCGLLAVLAYSAAPVVREYESPSSDPERPRGRQASAVTARADRPSP